MLAIVKHLVKKPVYNQFVTACKVSRVSLFALLALFILTLQAEAQPFFQQPAPPLVLPDRTGKKVDLFTYRNKYVLIDFWASWCPPCRIFNRTLVKLYKRYHPLGFEVLSVSLDEDKKAWQRAIRTDGMSWTQLVDTTAWNSVVAQAWDVWGVPNSFLIDTEGNIIARNLHGDELEKKLAVLYQKQRP
jgi:thiol-disulfide isomerase/thioredoxin